MSENYTPSQVFNFEGVRCPINYVKTKLALETMEIGGIIEVIVDQGEPARHVPKSVSQDGQQILDTFTDDDGRFHVVIKKTVEY
ncbi:MAG: sulfurtransferase TusA family protein [bacterium]|jgi:TusA-related sulfurtransferase